MARIKIKDLSKGIKVTEEELKSVRGGLKWPLVEFPYIKRPRPQPDAQSIAGNYEACQYIGSGACGSTTYC